MRKTKVEITCDDCKKSLTVDQAHMIVIGKDRVDFCSSCLTARVQHSVAIVALNRICRNCHGRGKVKECYGPHNDYNWVVCDICRGMKIIPL